MISLFKKWWKTTRMSPIERYLAQSTDLVELERRQRQLMLKGFRL